MHGGPTISQTPENPRGTGIIRPLVHAAMGGFILLLPWLTWSQALGMAVLAWLHNRFLLPVYAKNLFRRGESSSRGGMLNYPLAVMVLFLLFPGELIRPSLVWAILALGDPAASLVGRAWGRAKLPWNKSKSWLGSLAYALFAWLASSGVLLWWFWIISQREFVGHEFWPSVSPFSGGGSSLLLVLAIPCVAAALIESLDVGLDDNLHVPFTTALMMYPIISGAALLAERPEWAGETVVMFAKGAGVGLLFLGAAFAARSISIAGGLLGLVICGALVAAFGWWGIAPLAMFFVLGTTATKIGYAKKERRGIAQERGGQRGIPHVLANGGVALGCCLFALLDPERTWIYHLAAGASLATAAFDTCSSEVGKAYGRLTFILLPPKPVAPGTKGAASLEGTLGGFVGAGLVAFTVVPFLQVPEGVSTFGMGPQGLFAVVVIAAFAGATFESLVGGKMVSRNKIQEGHYMNTLNTLVGALLVIAYFLQ